MPSLLHKLKSTLQTSSQISPLAYYEYKFLVHDNMLEQVRTILDDLYGGLDPYPSGIVDSIYYDTYSDTMLQQCIDGADRKSKFRIRGYGDFTYTQVHHKAKRLAGVIKTKSSMNPLLASEYKYPSWDKIISCCKDTNSQHQIYYASQKYGELIPSVRIRYRRYRYRVFDYRITLDTEIEAFSPSNGQPRARNYVCFPDHVLEIKSHRRRPKLPFLGIITLQNVSYSKFMQGLKYLMDQ